jgi:hypothetical protein
MSISEEAYSFVISVQLGDQAGVSEDGCVSVGVDSHAAGTIGYPLGNKWTWIRPMCRYARKTE